MTGDCPCTCFFMNGVTITCASCKRSTTADDPVSHPRHYTRNPSGVECLDVVEHMNFCRGNVIKYVWRAGLKSDELEDLKKARFYLDREIARLERAK